MASAFTFTDEQKRIIVDADPDSDVLIIAGAGSGKTFTMTQRIIHLVTEEKNPDGSPIAPGSVLGLTFTKKAAEELRGRVSAAVSRVTRANGTTTAAQRLTGQPHVYTYDSFFQQIVRQYGLLIGVDPAAVPLSPAGRSEIAQRAADSMMDKIIFTLAKRDPEIDGEFPRWMPKYDDLVSAGLSISDGCLSYMIDDEHLTIESAFDRMSAWNDAFSAKMRELLLAEKSKNPQWYAEALAATKIISVASDAVRGKDPDGAKVAAAKEKQQRTVTESSIQRVKKLYDVARVRAVAIDVARAYAREKNDNHLADYADFTARAFQLLKRFPSIGREYRQRYRYVFLDEFQDTSTTQTKLLIALFHPKAGALEADASDDFSRSIVTAVGDPFQSIYGWRGASPNAFLMFKDGFELPGEPCSLSQTHRNKKLILDCANSVTNQMRAETFQTRGIENSDIRAALRINVKELTTMNVGKASNAVPSNDASGRGSAADDAGTVAAMAYPTIQAEALAISKFAKRTIARLQADSADFSKFVGAPVAVLMRSKASMFEYRRAIESAGLRCRIVGYADLLAQPEIEDLFAVLSILASKKWTDQKDLGSAMRLLASPRYSMDATDLQKLAKIATRLNEDLQYRSLVESGIATGNEDRAGKDALIRAHRDSLPTMGTLTDLLCSDDLLDVLDGPDMKAMGLRLSNRGLRSAVECGRVLRKAEAAIPHGVSATVRAAADALGLGADLAVAEAIDNSGVVDVPEVWGDLESRFPVDSQPKRSNRADRESKLDAVFAMIAQYQAELPENQSPSLSGFVLWSQKEMTSEAEPPQAYDDHADVVIMTIHQAKGLEWPAVVIADMEDKRFPAENSLTIASGGGKKPKKQKSDDDPFDDSVLAMLAGNGERDLAQYRAPKSELWPNSIRQIPTPLRSDAADLPQFPHSTHESDPIAALDVLTSTRDVQQEIDAPGTYETQENGLCARFLSLQEEYGMRAYVDELRLLYVALTRSSGDVLLTFHAHSYEDNPSDFRLDDTAGIFWRDVFNALPDLAKQDSSAMAEKATMNCAGRAAGADARNLLDLLMLSDRELGIPQESDDDASADDATSRLLEAARLHNGDDLSAQELSGLYQSALAGFIHAGQKRWPVTIGPERQMTLDLSALAVRAALAQGGGAAQGGSDKAALNDAVDGSASSTPLTDRARTLLDFAHAHGGAGDAAAAQGSSSDSAGSTDSTNRERADAATSALISRARTAAAGTAISATSLQRMIANDSAETAADVAKAILRPMPRPPYAAAASKGTRFHAWAADILTPRIGSVPGASDPANLYARLDDMGEGLSAEEQKWRERFLDAAQSPWISRTPDVIEEEYDIAVAGHRVPAKFDAVFRGAIADHPGAEQPGRYTIVDWKTGRPPKNAAERAERLIQLDLYRYAFSVVRHVSIENIDACLYYVSEADPAKRQIAADSSLSAEDILATVRASANFAALFADTDE